MALRSFEHTGSSPVARATVTRFVPVTHRRPRSRAAVIAVSALSIPFVLALLVLGVAH